MKKLMPFVAGVGLLIFALAVGTIVISLSYRALGLIFPNDLFDQLIGLALFDASALIWFTVFVYLCESTMQYVYAFLGFLLGLGGTIGLVAIEVGISSKMLMAASMLKPLTYIFIGVAVGHLILLYARHAAAPNVNAKISLGIDKAKIVDEGQKQAEEHLAKQLPHLGAAISNRLIQEVMRDLKLSSAGGQVIDLPALDVSTTPAAATPVVKIPGVGFIKNWILNRGRKARTYEQAVPSVAMAAAEPVETEVEEPYRGYYHAAKNEPPLVYVGEWINFLSAVSIVHQGRKIVDGMQLRALERSDGLYDLFDGESNVAFGVTDKKGLTFMQTGVNEEASPAGDGFRKEE